nr:hypothetical protein [Tanacetum cinerariifolium]
PWRVLIPVTRSQEMMIFSFLPNKLIQLTSKFWISKFNLLSVYVVRGTVEAGLRRARNLGRFQGRFRGILYPISCHGCDDDFVSKIQPQYTLHFDTADYLIISKVVSNIFIEVER